MTAERLKNLREWVGLLFLLFIVFDVAAVQYGMYLTATSPTAPDIATGEIVAIIHGPRRAYYNIYVTLREQCIFFGLLSGAAVSLIATLTIIVGHGIAELRADRRRRLPRR